MTMFNGLVGIDSYLGANRRLYFNILAGGCFDPPV
jgi:hypothetical protein